MTDNKKNLYFPGLPSLILVTRFADGRAYYTLNHAIYRRHSDPNHFTRCLINNESFEQQLAAHRRKIDPQIAAGATPLPPAQTPAATLEAQNQDFEDGRSRWQTHPYSLSDALRNAFKICPREYLQDT
jgi:hypothetical protein